MILRDPAAPGAAAPHLLVMLPGAGMTAADFARHGMVAELRARRLAVDVAAVQPPLEAYLDGTVPALLHEEVFAPARAAGQRLSLLGISLGGLGAILAAARGDAAFEAVILLAPYLGTGGTVAALAAAGGLAATPPESATAIEAEALAWLRRHAGGSKPALYLGYGSADRFAAGHALLAAALPAGRAVTAAGGHDWACWPGLWRRLLDETTLPQVFWPRP